MAKTPLKPKAAAAKAVPPLGAAPLEVKEAAPKKARKPAVKKRSLTTERTSKTDSIPEKGAKLSWGTLPTRAGQK